MSKLASTYAKTTGLKLDRPNLKETFYPLPFTQYLTIHTGSGQGAKNYDYWQEVLILLKPALDKAGLVVVQLGTSEDPPVHGVHDLRGKTSILQSHYLIRRGVLHMGNDSWLAHCKGWNEGPLISLYGSTSEANHGPYWCAKDKSVFISSHRAGGVPTYASNENPKSINLIPPEQVANSVIQLLSLDTPPLTQQTRFIGMLYRQLMFEVIPDSYPGPDVLPGVPFTVRMDYHFDEGILEALLRTGRKVNLFTNREISLNLLAAFRGSIVGYTHEINEACPIQYPATARSIIPKSLFYTKERDEAKVAELRYRFFDICNVEKASDVTKEDYLAAARGYLNWPEDKKLDLAREIDQAQGLRFKSSKLLMSKGKLYLSTAHWKAGKDTPAAVQNSGEVIDSPDYWRDANHHLLYLP